MRQVLSSNASPAKTCAHLDILPKASQIAHKVHVLFRQCLELANVCQHHTLARPCQSARPARQGCPAASVHWASAYLLKREPPGMESDFIRRNPPLPHRCFSPSSAHWFVHHRMKLDEHASFGRARRVICHGTGSGLSACTVTSHCRSLRLACLLPLSQEQPIPRRHRVCVVICGCFLLLLAKQPPPEPPPSAIDRLPGHKTGTDALNPVGSRCNAAAPFNKQQTPVGVATPAECTGR